MKGVILRCLAAGLKWFFGCLSPKAAGRIGIVLGDVAHILDGRHRRIARQNLRMAFGETKSEEEINRIIKDVFRGIGPLLDQKVLECRIHGCLLDQHFYAAGNIAMSSSGTWRTAADDGRVDSWLLVRAVGLVA